jgi:hypothetical protein
MSDQGWAKANEETASSTAQAIGGASCDRECAKLIQVEVGK